MTGILFPAGAGNGYFLFPTASAPALGPTKSPLQLVPEVKGKVKSTFVPVLN